MTGRVAIAAVRVSSPPDAWEASGFTVTDGVARIGEVEIRLEGGEGGIAGWVLRDAGPGDIDGLAGEAAEPEAPLRLAVSHPNSAIGVDHIVVFTPDLKRTITAMEGAGFELRRVRDASEPGPDVRQAFFRPGGMIVEVVENARGDQEAPAAFWGLTVAVADIERAAALLGDRVGEIRDAVQPGRRIATVRREAGLGVPVALITPHGG